ncbi:calcium-binding protein [Streptomyces sp. NPDC096339]|uniref:calcium-binding protein n=1 Tax=Streptomyces sp. NPDC096339 TaxID=3366086 RepID=UPI0037F2E042
MTTTTATSTFPAGLPFVRGRRTGHAPGRPWSRKSRAPVAAALGAALALALPGVALAAPGDPDTGFGTGGRVTTDFGGFEQVNGVAVQPDGKIIAVGLTDTGGVGGGVHNFAVARYNANGTPDSTFGTGGRLTTDLRGDAQAVAVQPDGKIVVAGHSDDDFAVARYNANGSPDTTFDNDGKVTTQFGGVDQARSVALLPDGRIVVAGLSNAAGTYDFAVARYNSNGSPDTDFDADGRVTTDFSGGLDQAAGVVLQADGRITAAGSANGFGSDDFALVQYNSDGTLDSTFGTGGRVTTDFGALDQARGMARQPDGKIVTAGLTGSGSTFTFALARYNADGSPDATFDTDGRLTTGFGTTGSAAAVALQGDGKIIAAGQSSSGGADFALARYNDDGALDTTFDTDGKVTTDFAGANDGANAVAVQADGKIVAAGHASGVTSDFALVRYQNGGSTPPQQPSLTIGKSHAGNFTRGQRGQYTITVGNRGSAPTDGSTVTVRDTLPAGLSVARMTGPGWNCPRAALTCTRSDALAAGNDYPPITLQVRVARDAPGTVTNTATVTGGGDSTLHTATDPTTTVPRRP